MKSNLDQPGVIRYLGIRLKYYFGEVKRQFPLLLLFMLNLFQDSSIAQSPEIDSLLTVIRTAKEDTNRLNALQKLSKSSYMWTHSDSAYYFAQMQYSFAKKGGYKKQEANALSNQSWYFSRLGKPAKAMSLLLRSLKINEEVGNMKGVAKCLVRIAFIYEKQGNDDAATDYLLQSLHINEELKDEKQTRASLNTLSIHYRRMGEYEQALKCLERGLNSAEAEKNKKEISKFLHSIGTVYHEMSDYKLSTDYAVRCLKIVEELGNNERIAFHLNVTGGRYASQEDYPKALEHFSRSLKIFEELDDAQSMAFTLRLIAGTYSKQGLHTMAIDHYLQAVNISTGGADGMVVGSLFGSIGWCYKELGNYEKAIFYGKKALKIAQESQSSVHASPDYARKLYEIYKLAGQPTKALETYELYQRLNSIKLDSFNSQKEIDAAVHLKFQYDLEKQLYTDSLEFAAEQTKRDLISQAEIKRKNQQRNAFIAGFILMIGLAGISFRSYQVKKRDNGIVTAQKEQVEHKNEEIMASINYAKKLQTAVLPPARVVKEFFADSFLLYLPRDIVSGDFYWMESKEDMSYFAVADCTGHGVPGAMLSVIGMNGLNRALNEQKLTEPKDILTSLSEHVQRHFEQSESTVRDGMDICLCALDNKTKKLTYSGANNPVWIARAGEMHILKPDRRAIGHHNTDTQFTQQEFQLQDGDTIYLSSDGYQDQLGGSKGQKLMTRVFREKLLVLSSESLDKQRETLLTDLETWRGNHHQTDDICVMGVRV